MPVIVGAYSQLSPGTPLVMLERALTEVYKPVLTYLYKHPDVHLHLYLPMTVMEWFEQNHPEMNMLIADLVKKDQVELLTGASQQQVLHVLPGKDRSGQLEHTTTFIRKRFSRRARTAWCYNQVWNPSLVSTMALGMLDRLIISSFDRLHDVQVATSAFVMQDLGKTLEVYPSDDRFDKLITDLSTNRISLREFAEQLQHITFDPGDSYHTVMINLDRLLQASAVQPGNPSVVDLFVLLLERVLTADTRETILLSSLPSRIMHDRGYLNGGWYGRDTTLVDISSFNDMFHKYEELNHLYGRWLYLVDLARLYRKNKDTKKRVEGLLMKAGSGGAFVLDSSGGCYRSGYRKHVYRYLNEAERLLGQGEEVPYPRELDIDFDGKPELVWMGKNIGAVVDSKGGTLDEINYLPTGWNYGDTFTGYATEAERLSFPALQDGSFQRSFNDMFLPHGATVEHFAKTLTKQAYDAGQDDYLVTVSDKNRNEITTSCQFSQLPFGLGDLELTKEYRFRTHTIVVEFTLTNQGKHRSRGLFGSELNLSLGMKDEEVGMYTVEKSRNRNLASGRLVAPNLKNVRIPDALNRTLLSFASDIRFTLHKEDFSVKLETVMGLEILYEYTQVLPLWDFDLAPRESMQWTVGFRIERRARTKKTQKESL
jgi:hypothetical protein